MSCGSACETCSRLQVAALGVVNDDGIEHATLDRIAARAGISSARAGEHYPTASHCVTATYEAVAGSIYEDFAAAFDSERRWRDGVTLGAQRLLARMAERPAEARLCFVEALRGDHELLRRRVRSRQRLVDLFNRELRRRHREQPERTAEVQLELLIGASFQRIAATVAEGHAGDLPELEHELRTRASTFEPARG